MSIAPKASEAELLAERGALYVGFSDQVATLREAVVRRVAEIDIELASIHAGTTEHIVLTRRGDLPGPPLRVYHLAANPCGRVTGRGRFRENFVESPESEARARPLRRCPACPWRN
jgi:hypothetical protein